MRKVLRPFISAFVILTLSCSDSVSPEYSREQIVYFSWGGAVYAGLFVVDVDGSGYRRLTPDSLVASWMFECSPDGQSIVLAGGYFEQGYDLWLIRKNDGATVQLTSGPSYDTAPKWFNHGAEIVFRSDRSGHYAFWRVDPEGNNLRPLLPDSIPFTYFDVSPISASIAFVYNGHLAIYDVDNSKLDVLTHDSLQLNPDREVSWSPDGTQLAFTATHATSGGLFTLDLRDSRLIQCTDTAIVWNQEWSPDSRFVSYSTYNGLYVVEPATGQIESIAALTGGPASHDWSSSGDAIAYQDGLIAQAIYIVGSSGGPSKLLKYGFTPKWNHSIW